MVAQMCQGQDACFFPTRQTIISGQFQSGAYSGLTGIRLDEGIIDRTIRALQWLSVHDSAHGWSNFLNSDRNLSSILAWSKVVVSGHSQGGGHAAATGKLFPVSRVIQFSASCDQTTASLPASWTNGAASSWQSDPKLFFGLPRARSESIPGLRSPFSR